MNGGLNIISLSANRLWTVWGIPITNSLISAWFVIIVLIVLAYFVGKNAKMVPGPIQNIFEMLFEFVIDYMEDILGSRELAERFFPLIITIFLFIFTSNFFEFLPFYGSVGVYQNGALVPIFRAGSTDLNMTLALAIMAYFTIEITGVTMLGFLKYGSKFVNFKQGIVGFFVGILEFIGDLVRLVSFSFRLFGNIFAGEVLIAVAVAFLPYILPVPIMLFETFVGILQAAVFALLTLVFIKIAITEPHEVSEH